MSKKRRIGHNVKHGKKRETKRKIGQSNRRKIGQKRKT